MCPTVSAAWAEKSTRRSMRQYQSKADSNAHAIGLKKDSLVGMVRMKEDCGPDGLSAQYQQ